MDKSFLRNWIITTIGVVVAAHLVTGIGYESYPGLAVAALILGILNAFLKPLLLLVALPLILLTMGFFILIINGLLLYFVGGLTKTFHVDGFGPAFWGALIISIVNVLSIIIWPPKRTRITVTTSHTQNPGSRDNDGGGPVIDV